MVTASTKPIRLIRIASVLANEARTVEDIRQAFAGRPVPRIVRHWRENQVAMCVDACSVFCAEEGDDRRSIEEKLSMEDAIALERCWDSEEATTKAVAQEAARQVNVFFESIYAELREKRIRHFLGLLKATPEELKRIGSSVIQIGFIDVWEKGIKKGFDRNQFNTIDEWLGFCVVCAVHGWRKGHRKRRIVTENGVMFSDPPSEDLLPAIELEISETARVITESCIKDDIDKAIVRMSIDGASVFEIAKYVELDPANVRRRRKKIADCVNSRMDTDE